MKIKSDELESIWMVLNFYTACVTSA